MAFDFYFNRNPSGLRLDGEIFGLKKTLASRGLNAASPGVKAAEAHFDANMNAVFNEDQQKKLKERNLGVFDMIYIDGVSASELYQGKFAGLPPNERDSLIKAGIISSMVNDRAKIDVATITLDKDGREKVTPLPIKPSVKAIQPSLNPLKRMINGLCSPFGKPFKTEDEKLAIANKTPNHAKDARLTAAVGLLQENITDMEEKAMANRHLERLRLEPTPYLQISSQFVKAQEDDRLRLCHALFGEEYDYPTELGNSTHVNAERGGVNIGAAMLFVNGHSFEQILDPEQLKEEKRAVGDQIKKWVAMGKNKNEPGQVNEAKEGIAGVYQKFAEQFSELGMLKIDHTDAAQLAANQRQLRGRAEIAFEISQEISVVKDTVISRTGKQTYDKLVGTLAYGSYLYKTLEDSVGCASAAMASMGGKDMNDAKRFVISSTTGIHFRDEISEVLTAKTNEKLGDIDGEALHLKSGIFRAKLMGLDGLTYRENGDYEKLILNMCHNRDVLFTYDDKGVSGDYFEVDADYSKGVSLCQTEPEQDRVSLDWGKLNDQTLKTGGRVSQRSQQVEMGSRHAG